MKYAGLIFCSLYFTILYLMVDHFRYTLTLQTIKKNDYQNVTTQMDDFECSLCTHTH